MKMLKNAKIGAGLSLRIVLLFYVVVPLAAAMILTGYLALTKWEHWVQDRMQADLEMVARAIQLPLSHSMEREREGGIHQALESALSIDSVYSAYAYNLEGDQIASVGKQDPMPEKRTKLAEIAERGERRGEYGKIAKRDVYSYFVPLKDSRNQASGLLQLTRRKEDFQEYTSKIRRQGAIGFALALGLMSALVLIGHYQALGRHFRRISEGMRRVAASGTEHRLPVSGPREIMLISTNFNEMLDSIELAEREIERGRIEQKMLEDRLRQSEKMAAIGQLAAGVAHELGSPLSIISGEAQRRLRGNRNESQNKKGALCIQRAVGRMEVIIRQLLDFSHSQKPQQRAITPAQVAQSARDAIVGEQGDTRCKVELIGSKKAPTFLADPIRLEQALVNLIRNGLQSGPDVSRVRIGWMIVDDSIVFFVEDDGPGIPAEIKPRLFEPFFTTKNVGSGTGLGLAVVHGIVEEHGGTIEVKKSDMGGARFELRFSLNKNEEMDTDERK